MNRAALVAAGTVYLLAGIIVAVWVGFQPDPPAFETAAGLLLLAAGAASVIVGWRDL